MNAMNAERPGSSLTKKTMDEKPIIFNAEMLRAIHEGRKTQTRRIVAEDMGNVFHPAVNSQGEIWFKDRRKIASARFGRPGDNLWVRETWSAKQPATWSEKLKSLIVDIRPADLLASGVTKADLLYKVDLAADELGGINWRASIHMPRWASRLDLKVKNIRVERLMDISEEDAIAEGIERRWLGRTHKRDWRIVEGWRDYSNETSTCLTPESSYQTLWESINGKGSWQKNPWVWVIEFQNQKPKTKNSQAHE